MHMVFATFLLEPNQLLLPQVTARAVHGRWLVEQLRITEATQQQLVAAVGAAREAAGGRQQLVLASFSSGWILDRAAVAVEGLHV